MSFVQKDKLTADLVQALAIRLGWSACVREKQFARCTMWVVYFTRHSRRGLRGTNGTGGGARISRVEYEGIVWCPSTVDGTWVARRNGTVFITGNSFPMWLPDWCIRAGSPPRCCSACGDPYAPVVESQSNVDPARRERAMERAAEAGLRREVAGSGLQAYAPTNTIHGWLPTCDCHAPHDWIAAEGNTVCRRCHVASFCDPLPPCSRPAVILDPFVGSGTTLLAAERLGRDAIGIDLNLEYLDITERRATQDQGLFAEVEVSAAPAVPAQLDLFGDTEPEELAGAGGTGV